jgi:hypothetical protein
MKKFFSLNLVAWICLTACAGLLGWTTYQIQSLKEQVVKQEHELYIMFLIQARQIRTLQNLEMRRINPDIQRRLDEVKKKYAKLEEEALANPEKH